MGYRNLKPKHRACEHVYEITEAGKWLRKAFEWKAEGVLTNVEIVKRLEARGLRLTVSNFKWVLSNPFYAGYVTGKLVEGQLIEGKHPRLVDLKTFLKANQLLASAVNNSVPKMSKKEEVPLKVFMRELHSNSPLTGYQTKGIWYYKARAKGVGVNVRASELNAVFASLLKSFEFDKKRKAAFARVIEDRLRIRLKDALEQQAALKKQGAELKSQLEAIEERYALGKITDAMFEKFAGTYQSQINQINSELRKSAVDSSNLKTVVEKAIHIAQKLSQA